MRCLVSTKYFQEVDDDAEITIAGNIDKPNPPDQPPEFDENATRVDIMKALLANRRNPGMVFHVFDIKFVLLWY